MNAHEIRRLNLHIWAEKISRQKLAEKLGYDAITYINGCLNGSNKIGPGAPRKWEIKLGLDAGWFDIPHHKEWSKLKGQEINKDDVIDQILAEDSADLTLEEKHGLRAYIAVLKAQRADS